MEYSDEQKVAEYVQHAARCDTNHSVKSLTLVAQIVIKNKGADNYGSGDKHPHTVVSGEGQDGFGATEEQEKRVEE